MKQPNKNSLSIVPGFRARQDLRVHRGLRMLRELRLTLMGHAPFQRLEQCEFQW